MAMTWMACSSVLARDLRVKRARKRLARGTSPDALSRVASSAA